MRRAIPLLLAALSACYGPYDEGWDDGCYDGGLDGAMWGGVDAALCYSSYPVPEPVSAGPTRYDEGYTDGYASCFVDEYRAAYRFAGAELAADLGECETLY